MAFGPLFMRQSLFRIALVLALGCVGSSYFGDKAFSDATTSAVARPATGSWESGWAKGLTVSVNGPIPLIVVDQFGYPRNAPKFAVIRDPRIGYDNAVQFTPGTTYAVIDTSTGKRAKIGSPHVWNKGVTHKASGDKAWWFDFSDVTNPGTYAILDVERGIRSVEFEIGDRVYRRVLKHATRMYFYQRAGFKKTAKEAGSDWADGASHLGPGQDPHSRSWLAKGDATLVKDLHGGWYDAGDYNKYTSWTARSVIVLLRAFEENKEAFNDDSNIPESRNGIPDILDEVRWALDWLQRMQNLDGSMLCVQGLDQASPPSAATGPSYYGPPTTAASLMGAAAFAYASKVFSARPEPELKAYGAKLLARAKRAWDWAIANPNVQYFNNDNNRQPGSKGLAAGQQEMSPSQRLFARFEAAVYLYEVTGEARFGSFAESTYASIVPKWGPSQWHTERQEALLYYTRLPGVADNVKTAILKRFITNITQNPDQLPMVLENKNPYRAPIKAYTWGSNQSIASQARLYQLLARYGDSKRTAAVAAARAAALDYVHYIHGVNPLGLVYLTNMKRAGAEHSASTMFHAWFTHGSARWARVSETTPGPPPGYLVGGPNPRFRPDTCCSAAFGTSKYRCYWSAKFSFCKFDFVPPLAQPAMKSYRNFNMGWPANSWSVTEPSITYQAKFIRLLAAYVR